MKELHFLKHSFVGRLYKVGKSKMFIQKGNVLIPVVIHTNLMWPQAQFCGPAIQGPREADVIILDLVW